MKNLIELTQWVAAMNKGKGKGGKKGGMGKPSCLIATLAMALVFGAFQPAKAAQNYVGPSSPITWSNNTGATVGSGKLVAAGPRYVVTGSEIVTATVGTVFTEGVWAFNRATTNAIAYGQPLFYNNATSVTDNAGTTNLIGIAAEAVPACTTAQWVNVGYTVKVLLNVPNRAAVYGASGIFTNHSASPVTVVNGIITSIDNT